MHSRGFVELEAAAREMVKLYAETYPIVCDRCNCSRCLYYRDVKGALEQLDARKRVERLTQPDG